jgi:hypothetical protein
VADQPFAFGRTATQPRHVGFGRRLIDEDQSRRIEPALAALPPPARLRNIGTVLFGRMERLFLYVSPILAKTQWMAATVHPKPKRCLISASVRSGSLATSCFISPPRSGINFSLRPQYRYLARKSPVRALCAKSFFTIPNDTLNRFATSSLVPSCASHAATILSLKSSDICFFIPPLYSNL